MNNSIQELYNEHLIIANALDVARQASVLIGKDNKLYDRVMRKLITFFREYSDNYHHQKEETILFPEIAKRRQILQDGVISEMNENHDDFREKISLIENCLNAEDYPKAFKIMDRYAEALLDHIAVENDELFIVAETLLDKEQLEKVYFKFIDCDRELGEARKAELVNMVAELKGAIMMPA